MPPYQQLQEVPEAGIGGVEGRGPDPRFPAGQDPHKDIIMETINLLNRDIRRCSAHPAIVKALIEHLVLNDKSSAGVLCEACGCQVHVDWTAQLVFIGEAPTLAEFINRTQWTILFEPDPIADAEGLANKGIVDRQGRFDAKGRIYGKRRLLR